jgi:hypothetical protein
MLLRKCLRPCLSTSATQFDSGGVEGADLAMFLVIRTHSCQMNGSIVAAVLYKRQNELI